MAISTVNNAPAATTPVAPGGRNPRRAGPASLITCIVALVLSAAFTIAGLGIAYAGWMVRDGDGYYMGDDTRMSSESFVIERDAILINDVGPNPRFLDTILGEAKVDVTSTSREPIFAGIARTEEVHDLLSRLADRGRASASRVSARVTGSDIWSERSSGTGTQSLVWPVQPGSWTVVIMNSDGRRGVEADVAVGATAPVLEAMLPWLLALGGISAAVAAAAVVLPSGSRRREAGHPSTQ